MAIWQTRFHISSVGDIDALLPGFGVNEHMVFCELWIEATDALAGGAFALFGKEHGKSENCRLRFTAADASCGHGSRTLGAVGAPPYTSSRLRRS